MIIEKTPPPPYTPSEGPSTPTTSADLPPDIARCNLLSLDRSVSSITGPFVVDPGMRVPSALLAPLPEDGDENEDEERNHQQRANLRLKSSFGRIDADVWVLDSNEPTRVDVFSECGPVDLRLHALGGSRSNVAIRTSFGPVRLELPPTFVGELIVRTSFASVSTRSPRIAIMSEVDGARRCFVGDPSLLGDNEWQGSSVVVEAECGSVTVSFTDDAPQTRPGFLSWLLT